MKKIFKILIFLSAAMCFAAGKNGNKKSSSNQKSNSAVPAWVLNVKSVYDDAHYIAQSASATLKETARDKALSLVVEYFKSQVTVLNVSSSVLTEKKLGNDALYTSDRVFGENVNVESDVELYGIEYAYYFSEKENLNYCVAYMNRENTWKMIEGDLEILLKTARENFNNAKNASDVFTKIRLYAKNKPVLEEFQEKYYFARVVDYKKTEKYKEIEDIKFESEKQILALRDKGAISIVNKTAAAKKVEKKLREVLEAEGFTVTSEKASFKANVDCEMESQVQGEYVISYPKISVEVFEGAKTVYSFAKTSGRVVGIDETSLKTKATKKVEEMLEEMFK